MKKSPEKNFQENSSKNKSYSFYFKNKTQTKSTASITTTQSNCSKHFRIQSKQISLIKDRNKTPIRIINNSNSKFTIDNNTNLNNNKMNNDSLYDDLLLIEGKRILNNLNEGLKKSSDKKYIINKQKIMNSDKNNLLENLFSNDKNKNLKNNLQKTKKIENTNNKYKKLNISRSRNRIEHSLLNQYYSTINIQNQKSVLSKSTKTLNIKSKSNEKIKTHKKEKNNIISQILKTMNNTMIAKIKKNYQKEHYLNTIYKNNRTCPKISTIKLFQK